MATLPPVLQSLRDAVSPAQYEQALSHALDRLSASLSVPETQRLAVAALAPTALCDASSVVARFASVASVCASPSRKAEAVGHTLLLRLTHWVHECPEALLAAQETLLGVFQANAALLGGVLSGVEATEAPLDTVSLRVARPTLTAALLEASTRHVQKLAVIHTLVRVAWAGESEEEEGAKETVTRMLVRSTTLNPLSKEEDAWAVYAPLVASTVDLLVASEATAASSGSSSVANAVVRRVLFGLEHQLSVLALLHSLLELTRACARSLCSSSLLFLLGVVLQHAESGDHEQRLVLQILQAVLPPSSSFSPSRAVYVESLVIPLVAVLSSHPQEASPLLQLVLDTASTLPLIGHSGDASKPHTYGEEGAHAASFLALKTSPSTCEAWLASLFQTPDSAIKDPPLTLLLQLGACLVDTRGRIRFFALDALERQLQLRRAHKNAATNWTPSAAKLLVSTLVALTSYRPPATADLTTTGEWLSRCYQVLASLAATTTETMKVILRLIKRMAAAAEAQATLRAQALHLLLLVWKQDSRVYPQLEAMLQQTDRDDDSEEHQGEEEELEIVRMATILAVCEKDPETGVDWITDIQKFLNHDRVSIVSMAVRAISLLCVADCLDFETVVKSFANKLKKNRISCVDDALFHQELCKFYAFGGSTEISSKYLAKVLSDLWEYAESDDASVRLEAFAALNDFSLEVLGLRVVDTHAKARDEDEDEEEDELTEQDVEENVDRVWQYLRTEPDGGVRVQIEKLIEKILEAESKSLAPGGAGRTGTGIASAAAFASKESRVSAAATKELKKNLPTRTQVIQQLDAMTQWRAYLLAYEPADLVESSSVAKQRKDKRLRVVTAHIDEMKAILQRSLEASSSTSCSQDNSTSQEQFSELLKSMEAWSAFGRKYIDRFEELARLRTPTDAPVGHTAAVLNMLVGQQFTTLDESSEHVHRWLALGALVNHASLCSSSGSLTEVVLKARAAMRAQLQQSIEELKVFKDALHSIELQYVLLGLVLAYPTNSDVHLEATLPRVVPFLESKESELLRGAAILFVSHASSLGPRDEEDRRARRSRTHLGAVSVLSALLRSSCGEASSNAAASVFSDPPRTAKWDDIALSKSNNEAVVKWAAAMGLAQLSTRFALVTRLSWLDSLRSVLSKLWEQQLSSLSSSLSVGVALGPILLESVRHNLIPASQVQHFVSTLLQHLEKRAATSTPCGAVVIPLLLQRMESYGCGVSTLDVDGLVRFIESRASEKDTSSALGFTAGNLLYVSTGVVGPRGAVTDQEFAWEPSVAARIVGVLQDGSNSSTYALASIVDRVDSFFVVQKNKTFDAQAQTLPETSLVAKALKFLRDGASEEDVGKGSTQSTLKCLAHASRAMPLPIDFASLTLRVLSRYEHADQIIASGLDFAASHASNVRLLVDSLLASDRLLNYSSDVLESCVDALSLCRPRLTTAQQTTLLTRIFEALVENWSPAFASAFEKWIDLTGSLVETAPAKEGSLEAEDDDVAAAVSTLALERFTHELPFSPVDHASAANLALLRRFASVVLSKIPTRSRVIDCVLATPTLAVPWMWWRFGGLLNELLRHGVVASTSVVFQWLLRLDFALVDSASLDAFLGDFVDAVCVAKAASGKKLAHPVDANDTWLLELLDAVARTETVTGAVLKRSAFFAVVQRAVVWKELRSHEAHGLSSVSPSTVEPALIAHALLHHQQLKGGGSSSASALLVQRLWSLHESAEVAVVVTAIATELHVVAMDATLRLVASDMVAELVKQLSSE